MSTGGGLKVTTVFVALVTTLNAAREKDKVEVRKREIAPFAIRRAFAIIMMYFMVGGDRYVGIILYGKRGAAVLPIVRGCFRLEYRRLEHRLYPSPHPYRENHHYQHDAGRAYRGIGLPRKFLQGIHEKGLYISTRKYINVKIR